MNPWDDFWSRVEGAVASRDGETVKKLFVDTTKPVIQSVTPTAHQDSGPRTPPPPPADPVS